MIARLINKLRRGTVLTDKEPASLVKNGLSVGIRMDNSVVDVGNSTGHGRVWSVGLRLLEQSASVIYSNGDSETNQPDVWLWNGHGGALVVREPVVALVYEARWVDPALAAEFDPKFLANISSSTNNGVETASRIITPSFAAAGNIARLGVDAAKIDVVPLGVDLDMFHPARTGGKDLVSAHTGDDRPYIICVATLFRAKNLPLLRDAVVRLAARGFPHRLVCVTKPSTSDERDPRTALAELASPEDLVIIFQDLTEEDLAALIAGAAAFCMPSRFEGFGLPALEALACGTPVIVSSMGALPEVTADAAIVVEPTVQAIEEALALVLEDNLLARMLSSRGRKRAEGFSWERMNRGWMSTLARATEEHSQRIL